MKFREVKARLEAAGWVELPGKRTGHRHFKMDGSPVKVTVPCHPGDINPITLKNIEKQSGVSMN